MRSRGGNLHERRMLVDARWTERFVMSWPSVRGGVPMSLPGISAPGGPLT